MNRKEIYRLAEKKWGRTFQMAMLAEECSELSHSMLQAIRGKGMANVADEIADTSSSLIAVPPAADDH